MGFPVCKERKLSEKSFSGCIEIASLKFKLYMNKLIHALSEQCLQLAECFHARATC